MSEPNDPGRWSDGAGAPPGLASLLARAKRDVASEAQLSELLARVNAVVEAPSPAPSAPASTRRFWLATGGLIVGLGIGAGVYLTRAPTPAVSPVVSGLASAPLLVAPSSERAPSAASTPPAPAAPANDAPAPLTRAPSANKHSAAPTAIAHDAAATEALLLERARSALATNPAQSLALAQRHAAEFPHGLLTQEREVIAISALRRLGRTAEADARAARFDARFPKSVHQPKLAVPKSP